MTNRILPALALAGLLAAGAGRATADDPKLPDAKAFDKLVVDTLRDVHNKGADLYNTSKDFSGTYRMYQGALVAVRPLLGHRAEAQKLIDTGLLAAEKESDAARKAFVLHETIEAVRKDLKGAVEPKKPVDPPTKPVDPPKKPVDPPVKPVDPPKKPVDPPVKPVDPPKKPVDPPVKPVDPPKKPVDPPVKPVDPPKKPPAPVDPPKKPVDPPKPVAPAPKPADPKGKDAETANVKGVITLKGQPLAEGELALSSATLGTFKTAIKDGAYTVVKLPPGKYTGAVTGKGIPEKYTAAATSGLTFEFAAGANTTDIVLK